MTKKKRKKSMIGWTDYRWASFPRWSLLIMANKYKDRLLKPTKVRITIEEL